MVWLGSKERSKNTHDIEDPKVIVKVDKDTSKSVKIDTNSNHHEDDNRSNVAVIVKSPSSSHERHHHCCNDHVMRVFGHRRDNSGIRYSDETADSSSVEVQDDSSADVEYSRHIDITGDSSSGSVRHLIDDVSYDDISDADSSQQPASNLQQNRQLANWLYNKQFWRTAKVISK